MRLLSWLAIFALIGLLQAKAEEGRPNVLILLADDLGWGDISFHGNRDVQTPHIDSLFEKGLELEKYHSCPNGASNSASLLTGRYHYRTGVVGESGYEAIMHPIEKTLAESFSENGYRTAYFGAWHHGLNNPHDGKGQGFDQVGDSVTDALAWLKDANSDPYMAIVYFSELNILDHETIGNLDLEVGDVLASIDPDQTIVLFTSDNGPDQSGEARFNGHFYGGKGSVHEGGIRVPCAIQWNGRIEAGARFTRITSVIDWYLTLGQLCGLASKTREWAIDGASLAGPLLNGGRVTDWPNRILFTSWTPADFATKQASVAVRTDRWLALRDPRWRRDESIDESQSSGWELYDLKTDPFQRKDKGLEFPYLLSELKADFALWMDDTTDEGIGPIAIRLGDNQQAIVILPKYAKQSWLVEVTKAGVYEFSLPEKSVIEIDGEPQSGHIAALSEGVYQVEVLGSVTGVVPISISSNQP